MQAVRSPHINKCKICGDGQSLGEKFSHSLDIPLKKGGMHRRNLHKPLDYTVQKKFLSFVCN
jgi:hypothetical protein